MNKPKKHEKKANDRDIDFPDVGKSTLTESKLETYFEEVGSLGDITEIRLKGAPRDYATEEAESLQEAKKLLQQGAIRGMQLRYVWRDEPWWDTVLVGDGVYQLVRISPEIEKSLFEGGKESS
jgi:hypothetical protein